MGIVSSIGIGVPHFWNNVKAGNSSFGPILGFDTGKFERKIGSEIRAFNVKRYFPGRMDLEKLGKGKQFALVCAEECLRAAAFSSSAWEGGIGVAIGTTNGEAGTLQRIGQEVLGKNWEGVSPELAGDFPPASIPQCISGFFRLGGPSWLFSNACAAGSYAIGHAYRQIASGRSTAMLAGGVDVFSRGAQAGFSRLGLISPDVPRPFSRDREGTILGEGAGLLFLESMESASRRGAEPIAEVVGYGHSCDAMDITHPSMEGISRAIRSALSDADIGPDKIAFISVHGTGTEANDSVESQAVREIFGPAGFLPPVSSVKSMLGHAMGAGSSIECVATLLALRHQYLFPTANFLGKDERCDVDCVPNIGRKIAGEYFMKTASAFGGNNAALVFRVPEAQRNAHA